MAYPRKLTDEQRAACRQEYETTPISLVKLARKYGMTDSSLREWVRREKWVLALSSLYRSERRLRPLSMKL